MTTYTTFEDSFLADMMVRDKKERDRQSFIRWQENTRTQLTSAINLILSFSVATLGFQVSLFMNTTFFLFSWQKVVFGISLLLVFFSVVQGVIGTLCRLQSFRYTAQVAKYRNDYNQWKVVREYRTHVKRLDRNTWRSFCLQIGLLGLGIAIDMFFVIKDLILEN